MADVADVTDSTSKSRCSLIVAMSENGVIGRAGEIPWHLSSDLRRFKRLTMGHTMIMGRKTFDSIGRALPGRVSLVISRRPEVRSVSEGVEIVAGWEAAQERVARESEFFVIGGGEIYRLALPRADRIYLTRVAAQVAGDVTFPEIDEREWEIVEQTEHPADDRNSLPHRFQILERRSR